MEYILENYHNESERNVHVWSSIMRESTARGHQHTLGLIGGCYIRGTFPVSVFYKWLRPIVDVPDNVIPTLVLISCPDPRTLVPFPLGTIPIHRDGHALLQDSNEPLQPGHYMLYKSNVIARRYEGLWPKLIPDAFKRRSRTASQTGTASPTASSKKSRNDHTRNHVRLRDRKCWVTGQAASSRSRGGNFTGIEVAHIFPLMGVDTNSGWTNGWTQSMRNLVLTREIADRPHNAILLQAYSCFI